MRSLRVRLPSNLELHLSDFRRLVWCSTQCPFVSRHGKYVNVLMFLSRSHREENMTGNRRKRRVNQLRNFFKKDRMFCELKVERPIVSQCFMSCGVSVHVLKQINKENIDFKKSPATIVPNSLKWLVGNPDYQWPNIWISSSLASFCPEIQELLSPWPSELATRPKEVQ